MFYVSLTNNTEVLLVRGPEVTQFNDLDFVAESFDPATKDFLYTTFALIERDDSVYFSQLSTPKLKISLPEYTAALQRLLDDEIYPQFPPSGELTMAPDELPSNLYLRRPRLFNYEEYKEDDAVYIIPALLIEEARTFEVISKHPHTNVIGFHGRCLMRRSFITGLVLDRHASDLKKYIRDRTGLIDREPFMASLESAISHIHCLGLAHNDVNPSNILVNAAGMPVLTDFDSCRPFGEKFTYSQGTPGWMDKSESYDTSEARHDTSAIKKIRQWLDEAAASS